MDVQSQLPIFVENIHKSYGKVKALDGVSMSVKEGSIFALLGPNGAGKTTLIKILTTLLSPDAGRAFVAGFDVKENPAEVRKRIGLAGQYAAVDENLTGFENLEMVGRLYHLPFSQVRKRALELLDQFNLEDFAKRKLGTYSGGMRRRLDLAASLMGNPKILFLDEPTTGLDPKSRLEFWEFLEELVRQGATLLLTTQQLGEADHLANRIVVINQGKVIASGTPDELKSQIGRDVLELHLQDKNRVSEVSRFLEDLGREKPYIDEDSGQITLPVIHRTRSIIEAVRRLDNANIEIADIFLRRPTLDEVFITLTGKPL